MVGKHLHVAGALIDLFFFLPWNGLSLSCKVIAVESLAQSCSCSSCILGGFVTEPITWVMSHCVVGAGVADVSDTHSMVPRALCQSLWPCVLAGCSARETLEVRGVEGKTRGRSQGYELQWPSGKFSPASKWELARWSFSICTVSHTSSVTQPAVTSPYVPDGLPQTQLKGLLV